MNNDDIDAMISESLKKAGVFLGMALEAPINSPLFREMNQAAVDALDWVNDDAIIDQLQRNEHDDNYDY